MDILAKHAQPNSAGVRIATLNEQSYRQQLWAHHPITDFWRIGRGYSKRLANRGMYTMGDVARCSLTNPELLYKLFGINAELLIDHAWGYEPTEISDVKSHQPATKSISSGQVLARPYPFAQARIITQEMAESLALESVEKHYFTDQLVLHIDYDHENHSSSAVLDHYGRRVPKPAHGTLRLNQPNSSSKLIIAGFLKLFQTHVNPDFTIRRITVCANNLVPDHQPTTISSPITQADLFTNYALLEAEQRRQQSALRSEHRLQEAIIDIRKRYGKNAILRGTNFEDGATGINRHRQIGGHRA